MKNAIFKAEEQLQNGFKQIYPNNNNVEINVKSWHDARLWNTDWVFCVEWLWIRRARGTEGLTIYDTKLVKLLNFPQEFSCYGSKGEEVRYKLNGTSYDLHIWDKDNKVWVNYKKLVETE